MWSFKLGFFAILVLLAFSKSFASKRKSENSAARDDNLITALPFNIYTTLLDHADEGYIGNGIWKWRRNTNGVAAYVDDLIAPDISFSLSLAFKTNARSSQTVLSVLHSHNNNVYRWLKVSVNGRRSSMEVKLFANNETVSVHSIQLQKPAYREWVNLLISVDSTTLHIQTSCDMTKTISLMNKVDGKIIFVIGSESTESSSFMGLMSNVLVHKPVLSEYPWTCLSAAKGHSKRGTHGDEFDEAATRGRDGSFLYRAETESLKQIVAELQRKMVALDRRLAIREQCPCGNDDNACVADGGALHLDGTTWDLNACTRCSCNVGVVECTNHSLSCYKLSPCISNPCLNEGVCTDTNDGFYCRCRGGTMGDYCEISDPCYVADTCKNSGVCRVEASGEYSCECSDGFTGPHCESPFACFSSPCQNGGICSADNDGFECTCADGFTGLMCDEVDFCTPNPCLHDGLCSNIGDTYRCRCRGIFTGDNCAVEDWCYPEPCQNGARCQNKDGGYKCECPEGFTGDECEARDMCHPSPCNNGVCRLFGDTYLCDCTSGFTGPTCDDVDLCATAPCENNGRCINLDDSFQCICPPNFLGIRCQLPNECAENPCLNDGVCVPDVNGKAYCRCRLTHFGDRCEHMDYCRGNPCPDGGTCENAPEHDPPYICDCNSDVTVCTYADLCRHENPCENGDCNVDEDWNISCECAVGYTGDHCTQFDYCSDRPCLNNGQCINEESGYRCECTPGHLGLRCETKHPCRPNPCLNSGQCTVVNQNSYSCKCPPSHYGRHCKYRDGCRSNPCQNGGLCIKQKHDFVCRCTTGFHGPTCESQELCRTNPCHNGGTCVEEDGTFRCLCPPSHQGTYCEHSCNVCTFLPEEGDCSKDDVHGRTTMRWYYNKEEQSCQQFRYSGCGGNSNNFETRQDCRRRCIIGSCCSLSLSTNQVSCQFTSINQCKKLNHNGRTQVLNFEPGKRCTRHSCKAGSTCQVGLEEHNKGIISNNRCDRSCVCNSEQQMHCNCENKLQRREIQRLTTDERMAFVKSIASLKLSKGYSGRNTWDAMRDDYMQRAPIAQHSEYFLLWNRAFLWKMEYLLRNLDCSITIPFYDFTMDSGDFANSVIWQPNYFGGNTDENGCVLDHMFKDENIANGDWSPCILRKFNTSVSIPNMIDVGHAINANSFKELNTRLQVIASHVHAFIGGDMETTSRAYDPLFYVIHAYIDNLFTIWQKVHPDVGVPQLSENVQNIPFGVPVADIWSGICVEYMPYTSSIPCNRSKPSPELFGSEGFNLQGYNRQGFNRDGFDKDGFDVMGRNAQGQLDTRNLFNVQGYNAEGYNRSGYDANGYDRFGYDVSGFNREGFNYRGYDREGYSRYGLDVHGYDRRGYNMYGVGRDFKPDLSGFYDAETGFNDCCFGRDGMTSLQSDRFGYSIEGRDVNQCDYFFNGPFVHYYRYKLWPMLYVQRSFFLETIPRTCNPMTHLPRSFYKHNWIQDLPQLSQSSYTPLQNNTAVNQAFSNRFCFDVDVFLTWCPCLEDNFPAICSSNPCQGAVCPLHKDARCTIKMCGEECRAEFVLNGRIVNCDNPCSMNPCQNGGTCHPSRFSSDSESYRCECTSDYVGTLCEQPVADMCVLPMQAGNCRNRIQRWFYNSMTMKCEEFTFTGCGGNPNNFVSKKACDLSCSTGACCYRLPINQTFEIGFDRDGYDKYGFNKKGINRLGQHRSEYDSMPSGNRIFPPKGYGPDGFDIYGYDSKGVDRMGYDRSGYHKDSGFNRTGYNIDGEYDELKGFDRHGFDANGFDRAGFSCSGIDREGFNQLGLYYDFSYTCQTLYLHECEALRDPHQLGIPFEVISFSPGKTCGEVSCGENCGCEHKGKKYHFGQEFHSGCNKCTCTLGGVVTCECQRLGKRKEIRDLTKEEFTLYVEAVKKLHESHQWESYARLHAQHMPQANGAPISLPWHRYFLRTIEEDIRAAGGCSLSIPYFDWTIDAGDLINSQIWQAIYFGGDGCVMHHGFGSDNSWHPCIRRMFNTSINLPDAVIVQYLINEPSYEKFRLQLETISGLFHLWVGGHMASPFSPYDPVYISHWAFMDYIWTEWQAKNPNGVSRFPADSRYVKMAPFDMTPDDVLVTEMQICVVYIPPTLGTTCNRTIDRYYGRENDDYELDRSKQYNSDGIDKHGYDRRGFDALGWDEHGFNQDGFNRDGFDIDGFDRTGYNRYGYDRNGKTPYGLYMNGQLDPGADRGYVASLFDRFGFNKYGFDKHGLDRNGFDVFGYDTTGYDADICNYFSEGPHYLRIFYHAITQLKVLEPRQMDQIDRICPPITPLPDYWVSQTWLPKLPIVREIEATWRRDHSFDASWRPRKTSVTDDKLWLPVTPEERFCFKLELYSGCPIGTPVVDCEEDMCADTRCASHANAQCRTKNCGSCYPEFYDGNTGEIFECYGCIDTDSVVHTEGSTWVSDCNTCLCQAGMISCQPVMCQKTMCSHPAKRDGECCESCQDCKFENRIINDGQRFAPDRCKTCVCKLGSVNCEDTVTNCPTPSCDNPIMAPGDCCFSCPTDCMGHREGETWDMGRCDTCTCRNSKVECKAKMCPVVRCDYPIKEADRCCAECTGCYVDGRRYENKQNFMRDYCTQCTCSFGNVQCVTQNCPQLSCKNQETPHGSCCPRCRTGCEYQGSFYDEGQSFPPQTGSCLNCTCQNEEVTCARLSCPRVACAMPTIPRGQCCPQCVECTDGGMTYNNGQRWTSEDGCQSCSCNQGDVTCTDVSNCRETCTHGPPRNRCCKDCSRCLYNGRLYRDGQVFNSGEDECDVCSCQRGSVTCNRRTCPSVSCTNTETPAGECCPQCRRCTYNGERYEHGDSWKRTDPGACADCTCMEGRISCVPEVCPALSCTHPTRARDSCCRTCSGCFYNGFEYRNGDRVYSSDKCSNCHCQDGSVICQAKQCPATQCRSPVIQDGECCPTCSLTCNYQGSEYSEADNFISPLNPCLNCTCQSGEVDCDRLDLKCPRPRCTHPGRTREVCCPQCTLCEFERRMYNDGQTFTPPGSSNCMTCKCMSGNVNCETEECPPVSCHNPITTPGKCCPRCEECLHNRRTYENGATWQDSLCTECTCTDGVVKCEERKCAQPACTHPAQISGECCPTCDLCLFQGVVRSSNTQFVSESDHCQRCQCMSGSVSCESVQCEKLSCARTHMQRGDCCPKCVTTCTIGGTTIQDGQQIRHPTRRCRTCTCTDGELECEAVRCPTFAGCSHPSMGECCRDDCSNCYFNGRNIANGDSIPQPGDNCGVCTCENGNVDCVKKACPVLECKNPIEGEDECCPTCPEASDFTCFHNGELLDHGQRFRDECDICECTAGEVMCLATPCPITTCQFPTQQRCCKVCEGCNYNGKIYEEEEVVPPSPNDDCEICICVRGDIECSPWKCPDVPCRNPSKDQCCPTCDGCSYHGATYSNDESFLSPFTRCDVCTCRNGDVSCARRSCRTPACTHPTKRADECCPSCDHGCLFEGKVYLEGGRMFSPNSGRDMCQLCTCDAGSVVCKRKQCANVKCRNPVTDGCGCPSCEDCRYNGVSYSNKQTFDNPDDKACSQCTCTNGNVVCGRTQCKSPACSHPGRDACGCPSCDKCVYYDTEYSNGVMFPDQHDECNICECQDGNANCKSKECDAVTCANPATDKCGCDICGACTYLGTTYGDGDTFTDVSDECNRCTCNTGTVDCVTVECPELLCPEPTSVSGECCPVCLETCTNNGNTYENGESFVLPSNPCSSCTCIWGKVRCTQKSCVAQCTHPIARNQCCPDCTACLYQEVRYNEGEIFQSTSDPCQQCSCNHGNVVCNEQRCPVPDCDRPKRVRGKCCPECLQPASSACIVNRRKLEPGEQWVQELNSGVCQECECHEQGVVSCSNVTCSDNCMYPVPQEGKCCSLCQDCFFDDRTIPNNQMFKPDDCRDCMCTNGNVKCISKECPPLDCAIDKQIPSDEGCCKQCASCTFKGKLYADGNRWNDDSDACVSCVCLNSVVTCAPIVCKQLCSDALAIPGQCCPTCPGCTFNNKRYNIGDKFQPNPLHPCEICQCVADPQDGSPTLECFREQCPSLADCPRLCLQQPTTDTCCPTCTNNAECRYGLCNALTVGRKIPASDDKCMGCVCTLDETWICTREKCRQLNCPVNQQYTPQSGCCPVCDMCVIPEEGRSVVSGSTWKINDCEDCECDQGSIQCNRQQCQHPLVCQPGLRPYKEPNQCCETCVNIDLPCRVENRLYSPLEQWKANQCTTCKCVAGEVKCIKETCRTKICGQNEISTVVPGKCCPVCKSKPETCIAFGDPHFYTFDGRMIHFQGVCQYLLAADCVAGDFKVLVSDSNNAPATVNRHGQVSWVDSITLITSGGNLTMHRNLEVLFNGTKIRNFPYYAAPYFQVEKSGNYLMVATNLGVQINWESRQRQLVVSVPEVYKRRMCGLCGNFNSFPQDDLRMRNSRMTTSDAVFGNDWKVTGPNMPQCSDAVDVDPCASATSAIRKSSSDNCDVIKSDLFSACHSIVDPDSFHASCVYDACVCGESSKICICDVLEAYATLCRRRGVTINWRSAKLCPVSCLGERGYIFEECGSPCVRTCDSIDQTCYLPCVSGCHCPSDKVEHEGSCVNPSVCPSQQAQPINFAPAPKPASLRAAPRGFERRRRPVFRGTMNRGPINHGALNRAPIGRYRHAPIGLNPNTMGGGRMGPNPVAPPRMRFPYRPHNPQMVIPNMQQIPRYRINN